MFAGVSKTYYFVGLIITDDGFKMLKCDIDWLLPNSCVSPTVILTETMFNLSNVVRMYIFNSCKFKINEEPKEQTFNFIFYMC